MKIAYFSPLLPDPSGISNFSEELLLELKKYVNIDIFTRIEPTTEEIRNSFSRYEIGDIYDDDIRSKYDLLIFHAGNNVRFHKEIMDAFMEFSGILEIHDFAMHHFLAENTYINGDYSEYIRIMEYCHGKRGRKVAEDFLNGKTEAPWDNQSQKYTVNRHYIDRAKAIIVHSDMAKQMVLAIRPDVPVVNIPLHTTEIYSDPNKEKQAFKKMLNIDDNKIVFGSFGYANRAKRIFQILEALSILKREHELDFIYYIVGKVEDKQILRTIKKLKLKKNVKVLGYVEIDEFKKYMGACDVCFNLRYPTQGESSASLQRILGMGKPVMVTNIGTFEEYPDEVVYKISHGISEIKEIVDCVLRLVSNQDVLTKSSERCAEYSLNNFDIKKNAKKYYDFYTTILEGDFEIEEEDRVLNEVFSRSKGKVCSEEEYFEDFIAQYRIEKK